MFRSTCWLRTLRLLCASLILIGASVWLAMAWHIQQAFGSNLNTIAISLWSLLSVFALIQVWRRPQRRYVVYVHGLMVVLGVAWFLNIPAKQERHWQADVAKIMHYERQDSLITLHNVRNFTWRSETDFDARWETRQYDLQRINGVNVIASYWMGPHIAHTLVSFDFENQAPLVFSIEIRKEATESFSAIGGFFRQFELSLIAADEKDIVYTRSNVRGEQVYFFPIEGLSQNEMQDLFLAYLTKSDSLRAQAQWYNTLLSNCTTIVYDMAQKITHNDLPLDYRILASGYLPNYLHDVQALNPDWDMKTWYKRAHVNPRVIDQTWQSEAYSQAIRQGLPVTLE